MDQPVGTSAKLGMMSARATPADTSSPTAAARAAIRYVMTILQQI